MSRPSSADGAPPPSPGSLDPLVALQARVHALEAQLQRIDAEGGVEARWARHRAMLTMMEEWVAAHPEWAFFAPEGRRAWTVSALRVPEGTTGRAIAGALLKRGWTIGAGLDEMADAMIRIGHMGDLTPAHFAALLAASALSESALKERPGGSMSPFCEPPTVTSTPHSSWR